MIKNQCKKGRLKTKVAGLNRAILLFSDDLFSKTDCVRQSTFDRYYNLGSPIQTAASATMDTKLMIMIRFKNKIDI